MGRKSVKVYENLPFPIAKYHKIITKNNWDRNNVIFDEIGHTFEWWYETYIYTSYCDCCKKKFKNTKDRCLDHNHNITDKFNVRGIICNWCNTKAKDRINRKISSSGENYIRFRKRDKKWSVSIQRKNHKFHKYCKTLEEAIIERNEYINSQPNFYSI